MYETTFKPIISFYYYYKTTCSHQKIIINHFTMEKTFCNPDFNFVAE